MAVKQHAKQKILIVFSVAVVLSLLMLLALSGGNLALIKSLFIQDLSISRYSFTEIEKALLHKLCTIYYSKSSLVKYWSCPLLLTWL